MSRLLELLQLMQLSQKTGASEMSFERQWAMIIFKEGVLWHVEPRGFGGIAPEEVIYTLMGWEKDANSAFQRVQVLPSFERSVHMSIENFILEGASDWMRKWARSSKTRQPRKKNRSMMKENRRPTCPIVEIETRR